MRKFRKLEPILGIVLIGIAVAGLYFWETTGREAIFMEPVIVAAQDLKPGTRITEEMLSQTEVLKENKIKGAVKAVDGSKLYGKIVGKYVIKGTQISDLHFSEKEFRLQEGQSIFVLKPEWIDMCSTSLRRGDVIELYLKGEEGQQLGSYQVAYVKDSSDREVRSVTEREGDVASPELLEREDSTAPIESVEIICDVSEYDQLSQLASSFEEPSLVIVQREGGQ